MHNIDFIVKIGGSCITNKKEFEVANMINIKNLTNIFLKCFENKLKFIIIHGAGLVILYI